MVKRGAHDMGGNSAGPVDTEEHVPTLTERRIDAMMQLLRAKPRAFWRTDENRRTIESLTPDTYKTSGYYQKWAYAMRGLLIEKGILSEAEVEKRLAEVTLRYKGKMVAAKRAATAGAQKATGKALKSTAQKGGSATVRSAQPRGKAPGGKAKSP